MLNILRQTSLYEAFNPQPGRMPENIILKVLWCGRLFTANILVAYLVFLTGLYLFSLLYYFLMTFSFGPHFALHSLRLAMFDRLFESRELWETQLLLPLQLFYLLYVICKYIDCFQPYLFTRYNLSPALLAIGLSSLLSLLLGLLFPTKTFATLLCSFGIITSLLSLFFAWLLGYNIFVVIQEYRLAVKGEDGAILADGPRLFFQQNILGAIYLAVLYLNLFTELYFPKSRLFII